MLRPVSVVSVAVCARLSPKVHDGTQTFPCRIYFLTCRCNELRVNPQRGHLTAPVKTAGASFSSFRFPELSQPISKFSPLSDSNPFRRIMFACNVSIHLKSNTLSDCTRTFENDVLPLLRKQNGFKAEITFAGPGGVDVTAISLWANKADADAYNTNTYPQVLKTMSRFVEGTPKVQTFDVVNSTFHKIAAHAAA